MKTIFTFTFKQEPSLYASVTFFTIGGDMAHPSISAI